MARPAQSHDHALRRGPRPAGSRRPWRLVAIDQGRIAAIEARAIDAGAGLTVIDTHHTIVPGFVDVHVHGVEGIDVLDGDDAVAAIVCRLPSAV
jgi:imidazolonepropionase-like amidohydrolase